MRKNLSLWLDWMDEFEGGAANRSRHEDPGGATMRGITYATYCRWCEEHKLPKPTVDDLFNLDNATQDAIAAAYYWNPIKGDALPGGVDLYLADFKFMSGRAIHVLQEVLGVEVDGDIGPKTLAAIKAQDPLRLLQNLHSARLEYLRGLSNYRHNKNGWERRCLEGFQFAQKLVEPALLPAERHPVKGLTFWGAGAAALATAPEALAWLTGNREAVEQAFTAVGLPPEASAAFLSAVAMAGALLALYRRFADHRAAKEAVPS